MSVFARRQKLTCFFCGQKQSIVSSTPVRVFTCTSPYCQCVNHIDEEGNIVDYTPDSAQSTPAAAPRYGRSVRSPSPTGGIGSSGGAGTSNGSLTNGSVSSPIFCRTCQKHLTIKNALLADYLPPEDDPQFDVYWKKLPEFKASLEQRYPEPCVDCAPKASNRIKEANYAAKSAMIGRLLEKSQNMKPAYRNEPWGLSRKAKAGFWFFRGLGWCSMHVLLISWHALALLYPIPITDTFDVTGSWKGCAVNSAAKLTIDSACYESLGLLVKRLIPWSWLFLFWNYQALAQTKNRNAKLTGNAEFIYVELGILLFRMIDWWLMTPGRVKEYATANYKELNILFLGFSILAFLLAATTLKLVEPVRISLRENALDLGISPENSPPKPRQIKSQANNSHIQQQQQHLQSRKENNPYDLLINRSESIIPPQTSQNPYLHNSHSQNSYTQKNYQQTTYSQMQNSTDEYGADSDEMDWNPTLPARDKRLAGLSYNGPQQQPAGFGSIQNRPMLNNHQSPFANPIPPAPRGSVYPQYMSQVSMKKEPGPQQQRESFFRPSTSDGSQKFVPAKATSSKYPPMAQPKFFPPEQMMGGDTGLEGLLSGGLSLDDEPDVIRSSRTTHPGAIHQRYSQNQEKVAYYLVCYFLVFLIAMIFYSNTGMDYGDFERHVVPLKVLVFLPAWVAACSKALRRRARGASMADLEGVVCLVEVGVGFAILATGVVGYLKKPNAEALMAAVSSVSAFGALSGEGVPPPVVSEDELSTGSAIVDDGLSGIPEDFSALGPTLTIPKKSYIGLDCFSNADLDERQVCLAAQEQLGSAQWVVFWSQLLDYAFLAATVYVGWLLAREVWNSIVFFREWLRTRTGIEEDVSPAVVVVDRRGREMSPGLGEWVDGKLVLGSSTQQGQQQQQGGGVPSLRREGSSGLSGMLGGLVGGGGSSLRREVGGGSGGGVGGGQPPTLRRDGSSNLSQMAFGGGGQPPALRRDGSSNLSQMAFGGGGQPPALRRDGSSNLSQMALGGGGGGTGAALGQALTAPRRRVAGGGFSGLSLG